MKKSILNIALLKIAFILTALNFTGNQAYSNDKLVTYPAPEGAILTKDFTVKVRQNGQDWQELAGYQVKVDEVRDTKHSESIATMSYFDFSGKVEVAVTFNNGTVESARVRPLSYEIEPKIEGNTLLFQLDRPRNLSVEVNSDIFHNLHLFANPIEAFIPNLNDTNVIYFGPGIHEIEGGKVNVPSCKTLYLAGGAILKAQVAFENANNARLLGRGMIEQSIRHGVSISNSKNIEVEGIFCSQCPVGGSDSVTIRNVKSISYFGWGDGMNVFASTNILFDGVFCRNSDDCTTVYATRKEFRGSCKNITMKNSTLWADVAHPIFIGIHGNSDDPDVIEDLSYINIDILDHKEKQIDYQGAMAINAGDNNLIKNVLFDDIRVEDFREGQLVNLRIFYNKKYCTAPGLGIENVTFRNIEYNGDNASLSIIAGYNDERKVKNITFENLKINGQLISDDMPGKPAWYKTSDMAHFFVGEHVEGIKFITNENKEIPDTIKNK